MSTETRLVLDETVSYRLPRTVIPESYGLRLVPEIEAGTFSGTVTIEVDILAEASEILLNSLDLTIGSAARILSQFLY